MITLDHVSAGYGKEPVLHKVSVSFSRGSISALIGPNGCGKSTLLKTAAGLLVPSCGSVLLDGVRLRQIPRRELAKRISYLPQNRSVGEMTVEQLVLHGRFPYLEYPRRYRSEDTTAARQAMDRVGIAGLAGRSLRQLSGGERQKAYLAMSLAQQTDYILMDEPTTYLDAEHQLELAVLAQQLRDEGKAVVLILHDLNLALRCAQQITVLAQGQILQTGTPEEVYRSGQLDKVFHVRMGHNRTEECGIQYFYY